jgi:oxygen-independent coproporphyrinogen III oxidase
MLGLYLHIPFCKSKCGYCDFISLAKRPELIPPYLEALSREISSYEGSTLATVYFGGGTPSLLNGEQFSAIFKKIRETFNCRRISEVTVEANPESITDNKLRALKSLGANRLSIGGQSMFDDELRTLNRVHSAEDLKTAFELSRRMGFANVNIDLIYGIPSQTLPKWKQNLDKLVDMGPEHISLYPLTIENGTMFFERRLAVDPDLQADMYEYSREFLKRAGYEHYEISNWSKPGFKCRHNLLYWQNQEYIGVGAAAASYLNSDRTKNSENVEEYIKLVLGGKTPVVEKDHIDRKKRLTEEIILNMRLLKGVALTPDMNVNFALQIGSLLEQNLIKKTGGNMCLSEKGLLLANQVFREFV